ncbi:LexA family transcriptional regulator [Ochrobactrum soli]|uniref:HTH cro/C1-type domain-containing protein n=1 Tax=Ochrobactrum soli TaxID=2448455 RepID=A0A2P9HMT6_9HYPH|nr:LexA family transcriptional regulator [[Ochrobactrum] soli]SPL65406.1 hypothetical protein OHAE_1273 [[Ochrobactrum] soli]
MHQEEPFHRLKVARVNAGYKSATDAARSMGVKVVTYTAHENGTRGFDKDALLYAKHYGVDPAWLLFGTVPLADPADDEGQAARLKAKSNAAELIRSTNLDEFWDMPKDFLEVGLDIHNDCARVMEIVGDYMYDPYNPTAPGSLFPGDSVIIDMNDTRPTPPGAFAVYDGDAVSVKMVEVLPSEGPPLVRITGRNPRYEGYERSASDVPIVGRVKAKVTML